MIIAFPLNYKPSHCKECVMSNSKCKVYDAMTDEDYKAYVTARERPDNCPLVTIDDTKIEHLIIKLVKSHLEKEELHEALKVIEHYEKVI